MVCVWPLVEGLQGVDGAGQACTLAAGRRGWMPEAAALEAQAADDVQLMAGMAPAQLRVPHIKPLDPEPASGPAHAGNKKRYRRSDIRAERP